MINKGRFVITDAGTNRIIDLRQDWDQCFRPGQRVTMNMIILSVTPIDKCSNCSALCPPFFGQEIECPSCGVIFQKIPILRLPYTYASPYSQELSGKDQLVEMHPSDEPNHLSSEQDSRLFRRFWIKNLGTLDEAFLEEGYPLQLKTSQHTTAHFQELKRAMEKYLRSMLS